MNIGEWSMEELKNSNKILPDYWLCFIPTFSANLSLVNADSARFPGHLCEYNFEGVFYEVSNRT